MAKEDEIMLKELQQHYEQFISSDTNKNKKMRSATPPTCQQCGKEFKLLCRLKEHQKRKTPCRPPPNNIATDRTFPDYAEHYICKVCSHRFSSRKALIEHNKKECISASHPKIQQLQHKCECLEEELQLQESRNTYMMTHIEQLLKEISQLKRQISSLNVAVAAVIKDPTPL